MLINCALATVLSHDVIFKQTAPMKPAQGYESTREPTRHQNAVTQLLKQTFTLAARWISVQNQLKAAP